MPRGNPNQFKEKNILKREKTINLIRTAVYLLNETGEVLDVTNVSSKTKELDPDKKGISSQTFYKKDLKHIQDLMYELRIGPFKNIKISQESEDVDLTKEIIKLNKIIEKLNKTIKEKNMRITKLKKNIEEKLTENDELRIKVFELEMKDKMKSIFNQVNNI